MALALVEGDPTQHRALCSKCEFRDDTHAEMLEIQATMAKSMIRMNKIIADTKKPLRLFDLTGEMRNKVYEEMFLMYPRTMVMKRRSTLAAVRRKVIPCISRLMIYQNPTQHFCGHREDVGRRVAVDTYPGSSCS
jgi:hypothetical protein